MRTLTFSGYRWEVRNSLELATPGPNYFTDKEECVSVTDNQLSLNIRHIGGVWSCSEIVLHIPLGYGVYSYTVESSFVDIETNAVFGAFLYEADTQEIDIEVSPTMVGTGLVQFAIQPTWKFWRVKKLPFRTLNATRHTIAWYKDRVEFTISDEVSKNIIASWSKRGGITSPDTARFIFNLWLFNGAPPAREQSVIISTFSFTPHT